MNLLGCRTATTVRGCRPKSRNECAFFLAGLTQAIKAITHATAGQQLAPCNQPAGECAWRRDDRVIADPVTDLGKIEFREIAERPEVAGRQVTKTRSRDFLKLYLTHPDGREP
jgi:hypothetical protein